MDHRILFAITILIASLVYSSYINYSMQNFKQIYIKILKKIENHETLVSLVTKKLLNHIKFLSLLRLHTTMCVIFSFTNIITNIVAIEIVVKYSYYILFILSFINILIIKKKNIQFEKKILKLIRKKQKETQ